MLFKLTCECVCACVVVCVFMCMCVCMNMYLYVGYLTAMMRTPRGQRGMRLATGTVGIDTYIEIG